MLNNIDYSKYLSYDNKMGLLLNKDDVLVLKRYGFDCDKYSSLSSLIFDIDNYLNECLDYDEDLEEVLVRLGESNYYNYTNKW